MRHCSDGKKNEDETQQDCGGSCKPCQGMFSTFIIFNVRLIYLAYQHTGKYVHLNIFVVSVEIIYKGMEEANGISWSISDTNCKSILPSIVHLRPGTEYKQVCDLAVGQSYILNCESPDGGWWKSNYVVIENSVYCEYAQGTKQSNVTTTGMV